MGIQNILNIITTDEIIAGAIVGSIIIPSLIFIVEKLDGQTVDMVEILVNFGTIVLEQFSSRYVVKKLEE